MGNSSFAIRLIRSLHLTGVGRFERGCERTSVLLISSIRFVNNGRDARRRFFRAFGTLCSTEGRVILASSHPPGRVGALRSHLHSEFRRSLVTSVRPPSLRAEVTVVGEGTRLSKIRVSSRIYRCITSGVGTGVHRLRKAIGGVGTGCCLSNRGPAVGSIRNVVSSVLGGSTPPRIAIRHVVSRITEACNISTSRVHSRGGHDTGVDGTERVTVCIAQRLAALSVITVNRRFNGHRCSAVVCAVRGIRGVVRGSEGIGRVVSSAVGGVHSE